MFTSLILNSENYEETLDQSEAINTLILIVKPVRYNNYTPYMGK